MNNSSSSNMGKTWWLIKNIDGTSFHTVTDVNVNLKSMHHIMESIHVMPVAEHERVVAELTTLNQSQVKRIEELRDLLIETEAKLGASNE